MNLATIVLGLALGFVLIKVFPVVCLFGVAAIVCKIIKI